MNLNVGERLAGCGPAQQPGGYVVSALVAETPFYGLYAGKKIFYNFDFTNKRLRETDEAEWVDVFLRTIRYPYLDDPAYVAQRRTLARGEVRRILGGRSSNLWPEPIDLLEVPNTRDRFAVALDHDPEPIVVFAQPHGLSVAAWQETVLPLASILGVLAELLEFVRQAHAEGLWLHGLGPDAVLIDGGDRAHYVGTNMVIEAAGADLSCQAWARLFPPERFPRGFTAPEFFQPGEKPDARGDLYAWAALAYFLLTGQSPTEIALEQGKPWAHFQRAHFTRLDKSLREVPETHARDWADQLGVPPSALTGCWPANVVHLFQALLHPDPRRRPGTVHELLTWIDTPPPVPPAAMLALITGPGEAHVFLDWDGLGGGLDMVIRRGVGEPPLTPGEGTMLEQGPACCAVADPDVPLTPAPVFYTVFARRNDAGRAIYSPATSTELEEGNPAAFLRLADSEAAQGVDALPPRLALLFAVRDKLSVIQALARSDLPRVRGWALAELEQLFRADLAHADLRPTQAEEILWQALRDPDPALCQRAAAVLLTRTQTDDDLLRMARFVGQGNVDDSLRMVDVFVAAGLDRATAERVRDILEEARPTVCPECRVHLERRDRAEHLRRQHGYVEVAGSLLPGPQALERLWERVIVLGEPSSHERILQSVASAREGMAGAYVAGLEEALIRYAERLAPAKTDDEVPRPHQIVQSYLACLLQASQVEVLLAEMLHSSMSPVRDVAREGWLSILGGKLRTANVTGKLLKEELGRINSSLVEKILLCRRLAEVGIAVGAAHACLALLEADRLVACEECGARVRLGEVERHLRRAHGVFQFQGARGSFSATRDAVVAAACAAAVNEAAWQTLDELAHDQYGPEADQHLLSWVCHRLEALDSEKRASALAALAETLAQSSSGLRLLPQLVSPLANPTHQHLARQLALEIGARSAPPAGTALTLLEPLLSDRDLPLAMRENAVIGLLRTTGKTGEAAQRLLEAYVSKTGKVRAIEKLHQLEQRVGQTEALAVVCACLEDQVRMQCPKCTIELIRKDMVAHLWERHRLVLDGRRVREPWRVLDDWIVDYGLEKDAVLLDRCRELATKLDPEGGVVAFERKLLRRGVEDRAALADLCERAAHNHATLCPHCFGQVPAPAQPPPPPLVFEKDSVAGAGFRVVILDHGIFPTVEIETPGELIQSREHGSRLTRNGALVVLVGPLVLAFVVLAELFTGFRVPAMVMIFMALGLGMLLGGLVFLFWPVGLVRKDRLVDAAWRELVPELLEELAAPGIAFLGRLAVFSVREGDVKSRADLVSLACEKVSDRATIEYAGGTDFQSVLLGTLAALVRLAALDSLERGEDPLPLVAEQVGRCLRGFLPLSHATLVLEDFFGPQAPLRSAAFSARLQILIVDQAFAAGLELSDLADIGKTQPILAAALGLTGLIHRAGLASTPARRASEDTVAIEGTLPGEASLAGASGWYGAVTRDALDLDRLAQLRQLWDLKATRPWERCGQAAHVFDLAADAGLGEKYLARTPDLLLRVRGYDIVLGSRGLGYQDVCWTRMPERVEIVDRRIYNDDGFDLVAGTRRLYFAHNPQDLAAELEVWLAYYFHEFLAGLPAWHDCPPSESGKKLRNGNALICPECRHAFLGSVGEAGFKIE